VIDVSLTETLGRTLVTSLTTLLVLAALAAVWRRDDFWFCGGAVGGCRGGNLLFYVCGRDHAAATQGVSKEDVMVPEKEGADQDGLMPLFYRRASE